MKPLSPVDAVSPAFSRTRSILLPPGPAPGLNAPFRFWFFLKIAVIAALTQGNVYAMILGFGSEAIFVVAAMAAGASGVDVGLKHQPFSTGGASAIVVVVLAVAGLFALAFVVFFIWLWCRLRFTLFDLVLYRRGLVGQAWSTYGSQSQRFLGLTFVIGFALLLLLAVTAGPLVLHLVASVRHLTKQQIDADPFLIFAHVLPMYGIFFLLIIAAGVLSTIAGDFILPPMALEDAPLEASFVRFFQLLRTRFWYVALYMLIRFALELGIGWIGMMIAFIVLLILGGGGFGVGFVLYRTFWHAGPAGAAVFVCFCVVAGLLLIAAYLLMILALYGSIAIVKQSYALYFYGSYYPQLGDRLDPPAPVPSTQTAPIAPLEPFPPPIPPPSAPT